MKMGIDVTKGLLYATEILHIAEPGKATAWFGWHLIPAQSQLFLWHFLIMAKSKKTQHRPQQKSKDKKTDRPRHEKPTKIAKKNKNTSVAKGEQ